MYRKSEASSAFLCVTARRQHMNTNSNARAEDIMTDLATEKYDVICQS
jgi:hypothetical protein